MLERSLVFCKQGAGVRIPSRPPESHLCVGSLKEPTTCGLRRKAKSAWIPTTRSNSGETTHLSVFEKESLGNNLGRSCRPRKLATPVTTSAFVGTNQKDEPITSGLPVAREQSPVMSTNRTCGLCVYMRAAERFRSPYTSMRACSKEGLPVTCGMDYSYLKATIGFTRMARRAGM
jgi:hypothetical protein